MNRFQRAVLERHDRIRKETGKPAPTRHERALRRARNQRYQENLEKRQHAAQEQKAA